MQALGDASGIAQGVIRVIAGIYVMLEAAATKEKWLGEFREELTAVAKDLASSQAAFQQNWFIDKLAIEVRKIEGIVKSISERGRIMSVLCSYSDRAQLQELKDVMSKLKAEAITGMLNSIQSSVTAGNEALMAELKKMQERQNELLLGYVDEEKPQALVLDLYSKYATGSYQSIVDKAQAWASAEPTPWNELQNVFYVTGDILTGRSTLAATLAAELNPPPAAVHIDENPSVERMLKSLALQLAMISPEYARELKKFYATPKEVGDIQKVPNELFRVLFTKPLARDSSKQWPTSPEGYRRVVLIIDNVHTFSPALDEILQNSELLDLPPWLGFICIGEKNSALVKTYAPRADLSDDQTDEAKARCSAVVLKHVTDVCRNASATKDLDEGSIKEISAAIVKKSDAHLWFAMKELNEYRRKMVKSPLSLETVKKDFDSHNFASKTKFIAEMKATALKNNAESLAKQATSSPTAKK